jgi:hypothetical protein
MEVKPVEVYSDLSNFAIVRVPGRRFPGCVIQGDSLSIVLHTAKVVLAGVKDSPDEELVGSAEELVESLQARVAHYERVLAEHGMDLPYTNRISR